MPPEAAKLYRMSIPQISRRSALAFLSAGLAAGFPQRSSAVTGLNLTEAQLAAGRRFVTSHATVDIHAHPGRFFLRGALQTDAVKILGAPAEAQVLTDMAAGGITAALFNCVADASLLGF